MAQRKGATKIPEKKLKLAETLSHQVSDARALIFTDFRGMTVKEMTGLRRLLREKEGEFSVIKNRLLLRALPAESEKVAPLCEGPSALLLGKGDPFVILKALYTFMGQNEKPIVKGGFLEKIFFGPTELAQMSKLPPRDVLLAQVATGIKAPISNMVFVLQAMLRKLVIAISEIQKKGGV